MRVRIYIPHSRDEIIARDVRSKSGLYVGKVDRMLCSPQIQALFRELEAAANNIGIREAERLTDEIARLGFLVDLPGHADPVVPSRLQVMNDDDVVFWIDNRETASSR